MHIDNGPLAFIMLLDKDGRRSFEFVCAFAFAFAFEMIIFARVCFGRRIVSVGVFVVVVVVVRFVAAETRIVSANCVSVLRTCAHVCVCGRTDTG